MQLMLTYRSATWDKSTYGFQPAKRGYCTNFTKNVGRTVSV